MIVWIHACTVQKISYAYLSDLQQRRLKELKDEFDQEQEIIKVEFDTER